MVGIQIAVLRRGAGLTQAELAQCVHVSASAIGMYEQGRRLPATPILIALSQVFDVTIDYLVTGKPCLPKDWDWEKAANGSVNIASVGGISNAQLIYLSAITRMLGYDIENLIEHQDKII